MKKDLFDLSIARGRKYSEFLVKKLEYRKLVTFAQNKSEPIYNWFYYKEGFSKDLVWNLLEELKIPKGSTVLDPFCGTGNTLLACKQAGYNAIGFDILPLGVFVSNTKLQENYDMELLSRKIKEVTRLKFGETSLRWPDLKFIDIKKAFSRYARNDILFFKEKILEIENEKIRNFMFLGLLSIVSKASNTKRDGGVLRIVKKRHLAPVRYLLKNRLKRMYKDLKKINFVSNKIHSEANLGDARSISLESESVDACITSPPYLNYVDYTKIYGLELALLVKNSREIVELRKKSFRSHVGSEYRPGKRLKSMRLEQTLEKVDTPQIVEGYFEDIYLSLKSIHKALRINGIVALVLSNTCLPGITIDVDLITAEISEEIGFKVKGIWVVNARWCDVHGIRKPRPVRESIIILEKVT